MNRLSKEKLPQFYEYDEVPFLVYTNADGKPEAVSDFGVISSNLPEIVFEGEKINESTFLNLAKARNDALGGDEKYKEVYDFARSL